ncbi:MAG: hypothetical protein NUV65_00840 [Candidatus Roizmanbacteria bacterium]|nr:hypothetical protein [Candidatus Roizmanbacteria bacterium]
MQTFQVSGAFHARKLIELAIRDEYQFEIGNIDRKLLIVFYKGTWAIQDSTTKDFIQISDAPDIPKNGVVTVGICDNDIEQTGNPLWIGYARERLKISLNKHNGELASEFKWDSDEYNCRVVPSEVIADLVEMILKDKVEFIHVVRAERNGVIVNGKIV